MYIYIVFRPNAECNTIYSTLVGKPTLSRYLPDLLISSQFCGGSPTGSTAPGDSGGPSILRTWNSGSQYILIGIVSGGFEYGADFYTYIAHEEVWITYKTGNYCLYSFSDSTLATGKSEIK